MKYRWKNVVTLDMWKAPDELPNSFAIVVNFSL